MSLGDYYKYEAGVPTPYTQAIINTLVPPPFPNSPPEYKVGKTGKGKTTFATPPKDILSEIVSICPGLVKATRACPVVNCHDSMYGTSSKVLSNIIVHLNDQHQWSREKIAEWLDIVAETDGIDLTITGGRNNGTDKEGKD